MVNIGGYMTTNTVKTEWVEVSLEAVITHFVNGFEMKDGFKIIDHKAYIDQATGKVAIKLVQAK
jgi:hypothetical protein